MSGPRRYQETLLHDLQGTLLRRVTVEGRIAKAIEHMPRERQLAILMSWMSLDTLERAVRTIEK